MHPSTKKGAHALLAFTVGVFSILSCIILVADAKNARLEDKGPPPPNLAFKPLTSPPEECIPCENLFARLEVDASQPGDLGMVQHVEVIQRGEPKSGTGGMFEWATGSLFHVCQHLNQHYGRESCSVEWGRWSPGDYYGNHTLVFEPPLEQPSDAPCPCTGVHRVTITLCKIGKHQLPVSDDCAFSHSIGFNLNPEVCPEVDSAGSPAENVRAVQQCMDEAQCRLVDDRLQMVIFRDPRPAAVSSFYYLSSKKYIPEDMDVDAFLLRHFRSFCKWLLVRMVLFKQRTPKDQYVCFWYDQWKADPAEWYRQLFRMLGLTFPGSVLVASTEAALADDFPFFSKGHDVHGGAPPPPPDHTYRDDVTDDTAQYMDEMMREWIPRGFLARLHADE